MLARIRQNELTQMITKYILKSLTCNLQVWMSGYLIFMTFLTVIPMIKEISRNRIIAKGTANS